MTSKYLNSLDTTKLILFLYVGISTLIVCSFIIPSIIPFIGIVYLLLSLGIIYQKAGLKGGSLLLIITVTGSYILFNYSSVDDYNGYLFFADYIAEYFHPYDNYFNERRFQSLNFLQYIQASFFYFDLSQLVFIVEPVLPISLASILIYELESDTFKKYALIILLTVSGLILTINSSGYNHVMLLFLVLILENERDIIIHICLVLIIAMIRLSAFYVVCVFLIIFIPNYLKRVIFKKRYLWALSILVICFIVLVIWYEKSTGTYLFPLLGDGYHATRYGYYQPSFNGIDFLMTIVFYCIILGPILFEKPKWFFIGIISIALVKYNLSDYQIGPYMAFFVIPILIYSGLRKQHIYTVLLVFLIYCFVNFSELKMGFDSIESAQKNHVKLHENSLLIASNVIQYDYPESVHVIDNFIGASPIEEPLRLEPEDLAYEIKKIGIDSIYIDIETRDWFNNINKSYLKRIERKIPAWNYINIEEKYLFLNKIFSEDVIPYRVIK